MNDPSIAVAMLGSGTRRRAEPVARVRWLASIARWLQARRPAAPTQG